MARAKEVTAANVPRKGHPDRKRVLNVLAQQRYRQRARDKVKELEAKAAVASTILTPDASPEVVAEEAPPELLPATDIVSSSLSLSQWQSPSGPTWTNFSSPSNSSHDSSHQDASTFPVDTNTSWQSGPIIDFDFSSENLQSLETTEWTFPDDGLFEDPMMKLFKAAHNLAGLLSCSSSIWDPHYLRVVDPVTLDNVTLPPNLRPVPEQLTIPHHPLFDILPWPSVRRKIIRVFSLPPEMRPPSARDPLATTYFAYDMEDESGEGVRVSGADDSDGNNWEVGQVIFSKWAWAWDRDIIVNSNRLRQARGAPRLRLTNG